MFFHAITETASPPSPHGSHRETRLRERNADLERQIVEREHMTALRMMQNRVLELAVQDSSLGEVLQKIVRAVEAQAGSGLLASILLLDAAGTHLRHGAGPSLPAAYNAAVDGLAIGPGMGSCGTAAYLKAPVYAADIATDPLWADFRELALGHGLRACWSTPIFAGSGAVLGTFAMYYPEPRTPAPADLEFVEFLVRSTALVIERKHYEAALRESRDRLAEETRALEILNATGTKVAAEFELATLVQEVVEAGVELSGARFGSFFYHLLDDTGERLMLYALAGAERSVFERFPKPRNTALFEPTFRGTAVIRSNDILADSRYGKSAPYHGMPKGHLPVRSYLAVPVISRTGEVIGSLLYGHEEPNIFGERAERVMLGLAAQAAVAFDNARLFETVQRSNAELEQRVLARTAELEDAHAALRQSQKMEAVGQLTGGIAHDFNNMLAVVIGSLDMLSRRLGGNDARAQRYVDAAIEGARRAAMLTQRLLAFSRQQPLKPESIDANKLVAGMSDLLRHSLGGEVQLETVLAGGLWRTHVDPNQLENVILNLAVNARDAMPGGGRLTIETQNAHLDARYVSSHLGVPSGQYILIAVTDTGIGMAAEVMAKAFDPFFTTKDVGRGTGLGLSQVYGFIKQTGGHVKIYSETGHGTTVKVYLPRQSGGQRDVLDAKPRRRPAAWRSAGSGAGRRG